MAKANGAMKTSSVRIHLPLTYPTTPMERNYRRFVLSEKFLRRWRNYEIVSNRRTLQRKISMRSTKDQLVEKMFLW
ncbi:hypothetical protein TNCV_4739811 [Trichonephila clavipes]|nr:hypothetical protein TNCV_4739811 [Trichonephila clavipes]